MKFCSASWASYNSIKVQREKFKRLQCEGVFIVSFLKKAILAKKFGGW